MYKVSLNTRITKQGLAQTNRAMSTNSNPRQGGMNKLLVGGIIASVASYAYYQRYRKDIAFYHGDSDPYSKNSQHTKSKSNDALQELNHAGDYIKKSAEDVADTARDTFSTVKKEGKETVRNLKDESKEFLANHHLKEGDRHPEQVLSTDSNQTAFNAAHKLKQAKENNQNPMVDEKISSNKTKSPNENKLEDHAQRDVRDTTPLVSKDTKKVKPVWDDKSSAETEINAAFEDTKHSVLDTTASLGREIKSTVYAMFGDNASKGVQRSSAKNGRESWETRLGAENIIAKRTDQDIIDATRNPSVPGRKGTSYDFYGATEAEGNPMVYEKLSTNKTKPLWETSLEEHAQEVVRDTSTLVDKDTQKVRQGVWDAKNLANEKTSGSISYKEKPSFWSSWFGKSETEAHHLEQDAKDKWGDLKNKAEVTKNDVKQTASQSWQDAKHKAEAEAGRVKKDVDSTVNNLSDKSKQEASRLESGWDSLKREVSDDAEYVLHKAEDTASSISGKFKNETNRLETEAERAAREARNEGSRLTRRASNEAAHKAEEVKDEGARLTRRASNEVANKAEEVKDESARLARRASDSIYSKAEDAKEKAEDVKEKAEDTARSWYQAGTEQVKSGMNSVKNVADQDIHWAEEKVHGGVEGIKETLTEAKEEVSRLFGEPRNQGYKDHVVRGEKYAEEEAGQLRATRYNVDLKPAEVVVEEAHSHDM